jgi:phosphoribosyl 1,2-cyclic phosphodiesterase
VAGLPVLAKPRDGFQIPVYVSRLTAPHIPWGDCVPNLELFQAGASFTIGDIAVTSFTIPHDAVDPVAFSFRAEGIKIAIATDLGYLPDSVRVQLSGSDALLLESNHDLNMLKVGPYPWSVKQRVMGRMGHLSNDAACTFVREHLDHSTSTLILGHLSEHNNHPELVRQAGLEALGGSLFTKLLIAEPGQLLEAFCY